MTTPARLYLVGAARTGKTSRLAARLTQLVESGVRPDRILVLVAQQSAAHRFREALQLVRAPGRPRGEPDITTLYGLANRHVGLFFPLIARAAGFAQAAREPTFINIELAQYLLNQLIQPYVGEFDDLKLFRPRLLSQILDSMNKAAECGFGLHEIAARLGEAWAGEPRRIAHYQSAQRMAQLFRQFCLAHSLLDFSLLMDAFGRNLLTTNGYRDYIAARYRHVLVDNIEENPPITHDFVRALLQTCDSAMLVDDEPGGYRLFLGADPLSARVLASQCVIEHAARRVSAPIAPSAIPALASPAMFGDALTDQFDGTALHGEGAPAQAIVDAIGAPISAKYWIEMVRAVAAQVVAAVKDQGVPPQQVAVIAPFVEDVLRFELVEQLRPHGIGVRTLRPSRPLYDHPAARALVTLAKLRHAHWQLPVTSGELARALSVCIDGLDVARAQLLAEAALIVSGKTLTRVDDQTKWSRIGMRFYARYHALVDGLNASHTSLWPPAQGSASAAPEAGLLPLDLFWQRLFGDVLSREGFGLHTDHDAAAACDKLIRSARNFREVLETLPQADGGAAGEATDLAFVSLLAQGLLAAQYAVPSAVNTSAIPQENEVLLAPAFAYLTGDNQSQVQFWLDVNSLGWYERIHQPLTHPHVLSRRWQTGAGRKWTDEDEHREQRGMLSRVVRGLAARCESRIYVASSQLSISGQENDGPLARAIQRVLAAKSHSQ